MFVLNLKNHILCFYKAFTIRAKNKQIIVSIYFVLREKMHQVAFESSI